MTSKNPFQIRAEVLELAKDYMDTQYQLNLEYSQKLKELNRMQKDDYLAAFKPYTFDELMERQKKCMPLFLIKKCDKNTINTIAEVLRASAFTAG